MKDINVVLTVEELNTILRALGNLPYVQVQAIIEKIQLQARAQLDKGNGIASNAEQGTSKN